MDSPQENWSSLVERNLLKSKALQKAGDRRKRILLSSPENQPDSERQPNRDRAVLLVISQDYHRTRVARTLSSAASSQLVID
jgi:hypothetical protein